MTNNQLHLLYLFLLCCLSFVYAPVHTSHCDTMFDTTILHIENSRSLNDQLSIDGLNDHCGYIESDMIKKDLHTKNTDLCVMQLNVRGLLNKQTQIKTLLSNNNVSLPIDVILLCETWLKPTTLELIDIPNYKSFHETRKDRIGGGISILVSDYLQSRERRDLLVETQYLEHCIVEVKTDKRTDRPIQIPKSS